jgi:hypothetical protein
MGEGRGYLVGSTSRPENTPVSEPFPNGNTFTTRVRLILENSIFRGFILSKSVDALYMRR